MGVGVSPFEAQLIRRLDEVMASAPQKRKQIEEQANAIDKPGKLRGKPKRG